MTKANDSCKPFLFCDFDGVFNTHKAYANGYCQIFPEKVELLNVILRVVPECQIVFTTAWRYAFPSVLALETLLAQYGADIGFKYPGRVHGLTESDEATHGGPLPEFGEREAWQKIGLKLRAAQIRKYLAEHQTRFWCVLDDLPLELDNLVQTDPEVGLTPADVVRAIQILKGEDELECT